MPASVVRAIALVAVLISMSCGRETVAPPEARLEETRAQRSGELVLTGLAAPVRVIRDRWGIPHIKAQNQADLFFAQGFVQAQDRLFQMDLWRHAAQGRLSEVLGPNFIERDAMTRRVQYRGDLAAEWASYGSDVRSIAEAFTRGVNARIRLLGQRMPDEFRLAGWTPELWRPEDLINRTDAFVASGNAQDELLRVQLVQAIGLARTRAILPDGRSLVIPQGLDLNAINPGVVDNLRRVGTAPFFTGFAVPFNAVVRSAIRLKADPRYDNSTVTVRGIRLQPDFMRASNAWAVRRGEHEAPLLAGDPHVPLQIPPTRYLIHLEAPGWNVIGATFPWMPGVAIGHNQHVAWALTAADIDTQDIYVERVNPANPRQVLDRGRWIDMTVEKESIRAKGREPYNFERLYTPHGVIVATDSERHLAFAIRWSGFEPGGAAELAALALDRAGSTREFDSMLDRWKMPASEFVFAGTDGHIARRSAGFAPTRQSWDGLVPVPGHDRGYEWREQTTTTRPPTVVDPPEGFIATANDSRARLARIGEVLSKPGAGTRRSFEELQHDVTAWNAGQLVPLLSPLRADRDDVEAARRRLLRWDTRVTADSADAALYVTWEQTLIRDLATLRVPVALADAYVARFRGVLIPALVTPSAAWFDGPVIRERDALLVRSLAEAVDQIARFGSTGAATWGDLHAVTFVHPLAITALAKERFSKGPQPLGGYSETVMAVPIARADRSVGPSFRAIFDAGDWDRSVATNAPGQSESPLTPHFDDLLKLWSAGEYFPLAFSEAAAQGAAEETLTLAPR